MDMEPYFENGNQIVRRRYIVFAMQRLVSNKKVRQSMYAKTFAHLSQGLTVSFPWMGNNVGVVNVVSSRAKWGKERWKERKAKERERKNEGASNIWF
jgi:hypothetical protein